MGKGSSFRIKNFTGFSLLAAVLFMIIALAINHGGRVISRSRLLDGLQSQASNLAHLSFEPLLSPSGVNPGKLRTLDDEIFQEIDSGRFELVRVWDPSRKLVYARGPSSDARRLSSTRGLDAALDGRATLTVVESTAPRQSDQEQTIQIFVPLRSSPGGEPVGALEVAAPYAPLEAALTSDGQKLFIVVLAGLGVLYAAMLRITHRASTDLERKVRENEYQALHDLLTGLPNRAVFKDRVQHAIATAGRDKSLAAVMLMDLDRFKEINDTLGHHHGDLLLQQIGPRIQSVLREADTVARLGGDEFAVLLDSITDAAAAVHVADKIRGVLKRSFQIDNLTLHIDVSIGIALFPGHGSDVDMLLQRADVAMYMAKAAGTGREVYTADRDQHSPTRLALVGELRDAIDNEMLTVHYQPKVDIRSGKVLGVEALVRWDHPTRGFLPPVTFVPLSEHTGLIEPMTLQVLNTSLRQARDWEHAGFDMEMAVNLSVRNLLDPQLPSKVEHMLYRWGIPPNRLELELTETSIMADPRRAMGILESLSELGVRIAIDDFGTGYSSLFYLKRMPINVIKIDKSFILNMTANDNDLVIVRSIIDLAHNLGLKVVAEGVENQDVLQHLEALGCDLAQGFYHGRPMPAEDLTWSLSLDQLSAEEAGTEAGE
ncbi:MAG: putative bifunctional diguanylate cyclase/phosphodiesterase [Actinomycetota bacterium]